MKFGVIFDMDGVVFDSTPLLWQGCKDIVAKHGATLSDSELPSYRGLSWKDTVERFNRDFSIHTTLEELTDYQIRREKMASTSGSYVMPGLMPFLSMLKTNNISLAIGTSSAYDRAQNLLVQANIRDYFAAVASANDAIYHKPAPDIFLAAAKKLGANPCNCVVIEDGSSGVDAAHRAGMKAIGLARDDDNRKALVNADLLISNFSELSIEKLRELIAK